MPTCHHERAVFYTLFCVHMKNEFYLQHSNEKDIIFRETQIDDDEKRNEEIELFYTVFFFISIFVLDYSCFNRSVGQFYIFISTNDQ